MLEVKDLVKKYGDKTVVDHLSFSVREHQIFGFLGPNGAGKSTTMNIITGTLSATEGSVKINGLDIYTQSKQARKNIGYLPEIPPLYGELSVYEYLSFIAEAKDIKKSFRRQKVDDVMQKAKVYDVRNRLIMNLSKGYRQRVGIAQAILGDPTLLILDEPTVGLDPQQIIEIRDLILEMSKTSTIILSSHILSEISAVCNEIMIIRSGKFIAQGTPKQLEEIVSDRCTSFKGTANLEQIFLELTKSENTACDNN